MGVVLDHLAVGTSVLGDGWELFGGVLGGTWAYGGDSDGYWWGQLEFAAGPKIELLTPTGGAGGGFLERFLAGRGAGAHHFNFLVTDISQTLERIRGAGIEPVGVSLSNPDWLEAFVHPRDAHGIVVQVAQQGRVPVAPRPRDLPEPGAPARFELIEHHVGDLDRALALFSGVLEGRAETAGSGTALVSWPGGGRIRLVAEDGADAGTGGHAGTGGARGDGGRVARGVHRVRFSRAGGASGVQDAERAGLLGKRLGLTVELAG